VSATRRNDALNITGNSVIDGPSSSLRRYLCMPTFIYRCPTTSYRVKGFTADEVSDDDAFEQVKCVLCHRSHLGNPTTGEVGGEDSEYSASVGDAPAAALLRK
jgi:hypothetical protein